MTWRIHQPGGHRLVTSRGTYHVQRHRDGRYRVDLYPSATSLLSTSIGHTTTLALAKQLAETDASDNTVPPRHGSDSVRHVTR